MGGRLRRSVSLPQKELFWGGGGGGGGGPSFFLYGHALKAENNFQRVADAVTTIKFRYRWDTLHMIRLVDIST